MKKSQIKSAWNSSYARNENYVFQPCDEMVRFVSRYLRRRVGFDEFKDIHPRVNNARVLDVGCGIGRNLIFGSEMGLEMYGIDLSAHAVNKAQEWMTQRVGSIARERIVACDVSDLPWLDNYFSHAWSDSALDSMPFEVAQAGVAEVSRIIQTDGYFYCNLISGNETGRNPDFCGEVVVESDHERDTIQSYFNKVKIVRLLEPLFEIVSLQLHQVHDDKSGRHFGRWHVVSRRR